jgi:hypothetical protein
MNRLLASMAVVATIAGCTVAPGSNSALTSAQRSAASLLSAYILASNAGLGYVAVHPGAQAAVKACDNTAWAAVGPIAADLKAGTDPSAAESDAAQNALAALTPCMTAAGVPSK